MIGYASFRSASEYEAGVFRPSKSSLDAWSRIAEMTDDLAEYIDCLVPRTVLVEVGGGKVHRRVRMSSGGAGLATYGEAVGACCRAVVTWQTALLSEWEIPSELHRIAANQWTRGRPKRERAAEVALEHPGLGTSADRGHDAADALEMARWWLARHHPTLAIADWGVVR